MLLTCAGNKTKHTKIKSMKKLFVFSAAFFMGLATFAQNVDEIVAKHITAIGGAENWKKITSMVMEGTVNVMGNDVNVKVSQVNKEGQRQDISVAGMTGYVIMTPKGGWMFMPFQGQQKPEPMTADDVKESLDDLDIQGNLVDYQAKGHTVELLGTEEIEGTECYKVKVTRKTSGEQTLFIDKSSHLVVRSSTKRKAMGQEMDVNIDYGDYREINGIKVPYSIGQGFGTMVVTSMKINEAVPADTFADPK
jgi:hypothetical protein